MTAVAEGSARSFAPGVLPASLLRRWRYAGGKRDVRLDLLRGFSAFAMVVDHVGGERSWLYPITGGNRFYTGAAEAFVFISGMVMGIVYRDITDRHGIGAALTKCLKRAWTLYLLTIFLTLGFASTSWLLDLPWAPRMTAADVPQYVVGVLSLHRTFFLADIMLMYTFLVLGTAPLLVLLARGYTRWVLAGSWVLWLLWQLWPAQAQVPWTVNDNQVFHIPAWQVLFVTALVIGYHRRAIETRLAWFSPGAALAASGAIIAGAVLIYFHRLGLSTEQSTLAEQLLDKADVPIGRIVVFAASFVLAFTLLTIVWVPVRRSLGWLLLPLGHHALGAYALHIFVVALIWRVAPLALGDGSRSVAENTALQVGGVVLVWGAIVLWPSATGLVDCCKHCMSATSGGVWRSVRHGHMATEAVGAPPAPAGGALMAGDAQPAGGSGTGVCGHPEPHAHCA